MAAATANGAASAVNNENVAPAGSKTGEDVTVFHDPNNFNVKHPLTHEWTLWFTKPPSGKVSRSKKPLAILPIHSIVQLANT